jgi:hypothetical protein
MDLIQTASFGGPLANSVFCPRKRIDTMSRDSMMSFVQNNFKSVRCTVGSIGVPFEETLKMAEKIELRRVCIYLLRIFYLPNLLKKNHEENNSLLT